MSVSVKTIVLDQEVLVDLDTYTKLPPAQQVELIQQYSFEKRMVRLVTFPKVTVWDVNALVAAFKKDPLLAEGALRLSLPQTPEIQTLLTDLTPALQTVTELVKQLQDVVKTSYVFADATLTDEAFNRKYVFLANRIRLATNTAYFLDHDDIRTLMNVLLPYWTAGTQEPRDLGNIRYRHHGRTWRTTLKPDSVSIGCQTIPRYEFEMLAKHLGFKGFPFEDTKNFLTY